MGCGERLDTNKIEEKELFWEAEIFLQQAVSLKAGVRVRQDRFIASETYLDDSAGLQRRVFLFPTLVRVAKQNSADIVEQQFVDPMRSLRISADMKAQRPDLKRRKLGRTLGLQLDANCIGRPRAADTARNIGRPCKTG